MALFAPSRKEGTNLRKDRRKWSAVFRLVVGIAGMCQERSCPRSKISPWRNTGAAQLDREPSSGCLFFSARLRDFTSGWCFLQPREGRKGRARASRELAGLNRVLQFGLRVRRAYALSWLIEGHTAYAEDFTCIHLPRLSWSSPSLQFTSVWTEA